MNVLECLSSSASTLAFVGGTLLSTAFLVFADALLLHSAHDVEPPTSAVHWAPALLALVAFGALALAPVDALVGELDDVRAASACARVWILCSLSFFFGAIMTALLLAEAMRASAASSLSFIAPSRLDAALNLTTSAAPADDGEWYHLYVGYAAVINSSLVFASAGSCLFSRLQRREEDEL